MPSTHWQSQRTTSEPAFAQCLLTHHCRFELSASTVTLTVHWSLISPSLQFLEIFLHAQVQVSSSVSGATAPRFIGLSRSHPSFYYFAAEKSTCDHAHHTTRIILFPCSSVTALIRRLCLFSTKCSPQTLLSLTRSPVFAMALSQTHSLNALIFCRLPTRSNSL